MSDDEIAHRIALQVNIAGALSLHARLTEHYMHDTVKADRLRSKAALFIAHALKLIAAHKDAVERWTQSRALLLPKAQFIGKTLNGERYTVPDNSH